jgi:hypothetical protein
VHYSGSIRTNTDNKNYFPGSSPGIEEAGGRFDYAPRVRAHKNFSDQTGVTGGGFVQVTFPTATITGQGYDTGTSAWQPRGGAASIYACVAFSAGLVDGSIMGVAIFKNGVEYATKWGVVKGTSIQSIDISLPADSCNGNDVYQVYARCDGTGTRTIQGAPAYTCFNCIQH